MALNAANVDVAITGAVSYGALGSTAPVDSITPLAAAYADVGYLSEDGVSEARDRSTNQIVAWQGGAVVRTTVTEAVMTITFTMIETKKESVELYYASTVSGVDGSIVIDPGATGGVRSFVVDYIDGSKYARLHLPRAEVTEVGELQLVGTDAVGYEVTVTAYKDATLGYSGKKWFSALDTTP